MLPLAQDGGAGQEDRQHRDVVDHLVDGDEPTLLHVRIEARARVELGERLGLLAAGGRPEGLHRIVDDLLNIAGPASRLAHRRGVADDLDRRLQVLGEVLLELRRDVDHEGVLAGIHVAVDVAERDDGGGQEQGGQHGFPRDPGNFGIVFIDDGDGRVDHIHHRALGRRVDREGKAVGDQEQQHRVAVEADQFFQAQLENVQEPLHRLLLLLLQEGDRQAEIDHRDRAQ